MLGLVRIKLALYEAAVHTAPGERMDSEEPPERSGRLLGDIDEVVRLMHDAAAWMSAMGTPASGRRADRPDIPRETFVPRSGALGRELQRRHRRLLHSCRPRIPSSGPTPSRGGHIAQTAVRRTIAGRGVSSALIGRLAAMPRERRCAKLRLSTATRTCVAYTSGSDSPTSTHFSIPAGIPTFHRGNAREGANKREILLSLDSVISFFQFELNLFLP